MNLKEREHVHECPHCSAKVTTYQPAEVFHRCQGRPSRLPLVRFAVVRNPGSSGNARLTKETAHA